MKLSFPQRVNRVIDLTLPMHPRTPSAWQPGVAMRTLRRHDSNEAGISQQLMWFSMNDHCGTHIDAPLHYIPGGRSVSELDISKLCFMPGICLDFTPCVLHQQIEAAHIRQALDKARKQADIRDIPPGAFILLHTEHDRHVGTQAYFDAPFLTEEAALVLASLSPRAIGVNAPTVDDQRAQIRPAHIILLELDIVIIEGVTNSAPLVGTQFMCTALPLKLSGFTGSPIRLVAFLSR